MGMTSNQHGPYVRGYTRVTMGHTESWVYASAPESVKCLSVRTGVCNPTPRSCGAVNTFPGLVHTARQAMKAGGA